MVTKNAKTKKKTTGNVVQLVDKIVPDGFSSAILTAVAAQEAQRQARSTGSGAVKQAIAAAGTGTVKEAVKSAASSRRAYAKESRTATRQAGRETRAVSSAASTGTLTPVASATAYVAQKAAQQRQSQLKTAKEAETDVRQNEWLRRNAARFDSIGDGSAAYRSVANSVNSGETDLTYRYINNVRGYGDIVRRNPSAGSAFLKFDEMTVQERGRYNYLYNTDGKDAAKAYLDYISYDLNRRSAWRNNSMWRSQADKAPVAASVASVAMNLSGGTGLLDAAAQGILKGTRDYKPVDYNRPGSMADQTVNAIRSQVSENIEKKHGPTASFLYQTGMSQADSLAAMLTGTVATSEVRAVSKALGNIGTTLIGMEAGTRAMQEAAKTGASDRQVIGRGIAAAVAETAMEKFSLGMLLKGMDRITLSTLLKNNLQQSGVEASEEVFTTICNTAADKLIMGDRSELVRQVLSYQTQGYSSQDAQRMAFRNWIVGIAGDAIGGALGGLLFGGLANVQQVTARKQRDAALGVVLKEADQDAASIIIARAREDSDEGSRLRRLADRMQDRLDRGAGVTNEQVGKLLRVYREEQAKARERILQGVEEQKDAAREDTPVEAQEGAQRGEAQDGVRVEDDAEMQQDAAQGVTVDDADASRYFRENRADSLVRLAAREGDAAEAARLSAAANDTERSGITAGASEADIASAVRISEATGRKILYYNQPAYLGIVSRGTMIGDTLYVNAAAEDAQSWIIAHELTHTLEKSGLYDTLRGLVFDRMAQTGAQVEAARERLRAMYGEDELDYEIVADYMADHLLTDEDAITSLVARDRTLGEQILAFLDRLLTALGSGNAAERRFLRDARSVYARALEETRPEQADQGGRNGYTLDDLRQMLANDEITEDEFDAMYEAVAPSEEGTGALDVEHGRFSLKRASEDAVKSEPKFSFRIMLPDARNSFGTERGALTGKAAEGAAAVERGLTNVVARAIGIPYAAKRDTLLPVVRRISEAYLRDGAVPQDVLDETFNEAYDLGIEIDRTYYDENREYKELLRTTAVTVTDKVKADITDYADFCRRAFGLLRMVNEGGRQIDDLYAELCDRAPHLFPEYVTNPADQLRQMYRAASGIRIAERALSEAHGSDAKEFRAWARNDFYDAVGEALNRLRMVRRYAADRDRVAAEREAHMAALPSNTAEAMALWAELKKARRAYEKVSAKALLTGADFKALGEVLRGERRYDDLDPELYNVPDIRKVGEKLEVYEKLQRDIRDYNGIIRDQRREQMDALLEGNLLKFRDKRIGLAYSRETMERNVRDILKDDPALAERMIREVFTPVHRGEADATRTKNRYRDRVRALHLSRKAKKGDRDSEAYAVQLLGEAEDNIRILDESRGRIKFRDGKTRQEWADTVLDLWQSNPGLDQAKISDAVNAFRAIYNDLFAEMNDTRVRNGYEPINYRSGYFPHFQERKQDGILSAFGRVIGIGTEVTDLPTTINGLTHTFKPGIRWFGNALERTGFKTVYDAVEGFDRYIEGAASVIHQTDNIQRLRMLANQIRYWAGDEGMREQVQAIRDNPTLTDEERDIQIKEIYDKAPFVLSNFVAALDEYTNLLANKKSRIDRGVEYELGRNIYNLVKALESRVAANMVAVNPGSWLTNFIPLTQGGAQLGRGNLLAGMWATLQNLAKEDDGINDLSVFLTNREGSEPLAKTWSQKWSAAASKPMTWIDSFTAGSLVRGRLRQNMQRGMSSKAALEEADMWTASVMADRSKGAMPTIFESKNPLVKILTQFQLEVNNELSYLFKDIPREADHSKARLILMLVKFAIGAFLFNDIYEFFVGRRPALDPIGIINEAFGLATGFSVPNMLRYAFGDEDFRDEKADAWGVISGTAKRTASQLPFVGGLLEGGRVPISSALPDVKTIGKAVFDKDMNQKKRRSTITKELISPVSYIVPPFGGGQAKKLYQAVDVVRRGGKYTVDSAGRDMLQYPFFRDEGTKTVGNAARTFTFGPTALPSAQDWINSGFDTMSSKNTEAYQRMVGAGYGERYSLDRVKELDSYDRNAEKLAYISGLDLSNDESILLAGAVWGYDEVTDEGEPTQYAKLKADVAAGRRASDALDEAAKGLSGNRAECYRRMKAAGVGENDAYEMLYALSELDSRKEQARAISEAGLTDEECLLLAGSFWGYDELTEKGSRSAYGKMVDAVNGGMSASKYLWEYANKA